MKKVKLGVIGLGGMGSSHLTTIKECDDINLVAICDILKDVADEQAKKYDVKAYYDADEMMNSGDIDAVLIATPHYAHTPLAKAAFKAGLHVLSEKPIAVHKADAEEMIAAHKEHPELKFAAMFQMRTGDVYKKIKNMVDNGKIGKLMRVNWIITNWFRSQSYYDGGGWRATWEGEGGGVLLNQCPHQLDLFQWFFGMPSKVRAFGTLGKYHNIEVEDDVTAYCEFDEGFSGVFITSTGEAPGTNRLEITGDKGRVVLENGKLSFDRSTISVEEFTETSDSGFDLPEIWDVNIPVKSAQGLHKDIIANFADSILNGTDLIAEGEEGINSVELGNSILYSLLNDVTVELPLDPAIYADQLQGLVDNSTFVKPEIKESKGDFKSSFGK